MKDHQFIVGQRRQLQFRAEHVVVDVAIVGTVCIRAKRGDDDRVVIVVSDTGCGMGEELQRKVLKPFVTTRKARKGTGIGLSVVQDLVARYGGTFEMESAEGKGTSVTVTFPADTDCRVEETPEQSMPAMRGNERLVVVDDEDDVLQAVSMGLTGFGYDVTPFVSAEEALKSTALEKADLVISDLTMPEMDGPSFLQTVREAWPEKPLILCSGYDENFESWPFIRKPFTPEKLAAFIRGQLDGTARSGR